MELNIKRTFLHIPVGFITVVLLYVHWVVPAILTYVFVFYERNEDRHLGDQAWKDIAGWLWGAFIAGIAMLIAKLI